MAVYRIRERIYDTVKAVKKSRSRISRRVQTSSECAFEAYRGIGLHAGPNHVTVTVTVTSSASVLRLRSMTGDDNLTITAALANLETAPMKEVWLPTTMPKVRAPLASLLTDPLLID